MSSFRMDMVISAGKSKKNIEAFVLLPPDARRAVDLLIETRALVGVPHTNPYIFARLYADTPLSGNTELQEVANSCEGLQFPERITSKNLRRYIATVSQVIHYVSTFFFRETYNVLDITINTTFNFLYFTFPNMFGLHQYIEFRTVIVHALFSLLTSDIISWQRSSDNVSKQVAHYQCTLV
jgi:sorbitol-specific phosphotransferase system component IIBC